MDRDEVRRSLEKRLSELGARVSKMESDLRVPGSQDWEERATELENDEVLERLSQGERRELAEIRAVLARIEEGTYSVCSQCGGEISSGRLAALPYTSLCISCAS